MTLIKVCGIRFPEDACAAFEAGADLLGFVLASGGRCVSPEQARHLGRCLPPYVGRVGVCVNASLAVMASLRQALGLTAIQLHGEESLASVRELAPQVIRAVRPRRDDELEALDCYRGVPLLVDGWSPRARGGTGTLACWDQARALVERGHRLLLSGGLTPDNVYAAILQVRPAGVDVCSGVEDSRRQGRKDRARLRAFVAAVRAADRDLQALGPAFS